MIFSINESLGLYNSGVEHAEIKRLRTLKRYGVSNRILLTGYQPEGHYYYRKDGVTDSDVINMYDYFQEACLVLDNKATLDKIINVKNYHVTKYNSCEVLTQGNRNILVYFYRKPRLLKDCVKMIYYGRDDDYSYGEVYDSRGFLSESFKLDKRNNITSAKFYSPQGKVMITEKCDPKDEKKWNAKYYVTRFHKHVNGMVSLMALFFTKVCREYTKSQLYPILILDRWANWRIEEVVNYIRYPHYLLFFIQASHTYNSARPYSSRLTEWYSYLFKRIRANKEPGICGFICSTKRQMDAIVRCNHLPIQGFHVPVGVQNPNGIKHRVLVSQRIPKQIVCVDRLDPIENLGDTVRAFGLAHRKIRSLKLNIYGAMSNAYPKLRKEMIKLFRYFHLTQKSMKIYPYIKDVDKAYRKGEITLVTTPDEGFNISLLEALSQGCCGLTYNTNYGPNEMVRNNYDGFVVPRGDYKAMARKLVDFYSHPQMMQVMSDNAYRQSSLFSPARIAQKWKDIFATVRGCYYYRP